ncbi:DUF5017 domain-containing protein [Mucilaginibacter sp.]|jgi:hypothetical protein|uniref:DUF5017 domain-containing protein n=1 Tax=Mucilaginibacter sp. TaxID=1882438 RepID=UPI003568C94A
MKFIYLIILGLFILTGCKKEQELKVNAPEFNVTTEKASYKVGEEVKFNFTGNPDLISFYSGEVFNDYAFMNGRVVESGALKVSFSSSFQFGTQTKQFSVVVSNDFNGGNLFQDIQSATWRDITSRFALGTNATYKPSGEVDISDLKVPGKPLYIAFKYIVKNPSVYGTGNVWQVQNFLLTSDTSIGLLTLGDILTGGFKLFDQKPDIAPSRSNISTSRIQLIAPTLTAATNTVETESWAVTKAFDTDAIDYGPDRPIPIKGYADAMPKSSVYTYSKPGSIKAVFTAYNANVTDSKAIQKEVNITVVP